VTGPQKISIVTNMPPSKIEICHPLLINRQIPEKISEKLTIFSKGKQDRRKEKESATRTQRRLSRPTQDKTHPRIQRWRSIWKQEGDLRQEKQEEEEDSPNKAVLGPT